MTIDINNPVHKKFIEAGLAASSKTKEAVQKGGDGKIGKDDFMKILMAEVKNQDPFNPMDSKQYGAHLAQFAQLEQMVNMNTNLNTINSNQGIGNKNDLVNYIGKEIFAQNNTIEFISGRESLLPFNLEKDAQEVQLHIYNAKNELINTIILGTQKSGIQNATWDGKDKEGIIQSDGTFSYRVEAKNIFGVDILADTYLKGKVTGVSFENNRPYLLIGKNRVEPDNVMKVLASQN